jgi:hypothetical protein
MAYSQLPTRSSTDPNASADINQLSENIASIPFRNGVYSNAIINGEMRISQRGTSFAAVGSGDYTLDRWSYGKDGAIVHTVNQSSEVPSSDIFTNAIHLDVTTADVSIGAGDDCEISQKIEGYNASPFIGKTFTLKFWVRDTITGIHCISVRGGGKSYVTEYTINASDTWEQKEITITHDSTAITSTTNGIGFQIGWTILTGSNFQTTADTWTSGTYLGTSNQVNGGSSTDNNFYLTGVQLNLGSSALDYSPRHYGDELELCERYYQMGTFTYHPANSYTTTEWLSHINFRIQMRGDGGTPTLSLSRLDISGTNRIGTAGTYQTPSSVTTYGMALGASDASSLVAGAGASITGTWTNDNEL